MKKRLDSEMHKIRRDASKFQRWKTKEQRKNLVNVLSEKIESKENEKDDLLIDIFKILEKKWYGEHSPMHMEMHQWDFISICFGYQTDQTTRENYNKLVDFLKNTKHFEIKQEEESFIKFETGYFRSISIHYKEWSESLIIDWYFNEKQIEKWKDKYRRFSRSIDAYEEEEKKEEEKKEEEFKWYEEEQKKELEKMWKKELEDYQKKELEKMLKKQLYDYWRREGQSMDDILDRELEWKNNEDEIKKNKKK